VNDAEWQQNLQSNQNDHSECEMKCQTVVDLLPVYLQTPAGNRNRHIADIGNLKGRGMLNS